MKLPADMPDINPNVAELYGKQIAKVTGLLDDPEFSHEAAADFAPL